MTGRMAYGWQTNGGMAEYLLCKASSLVKMPDAMSYVDGAMLACGVSRLFLHRTLGLLTHAPVWDSVLRCHEGSRLRSPQGLDRGARSGGTIWYVIRLLCTDAHTESL